MYVYVMIDRLCMSTQSVKQQHGYRILSVCRALATDKKLRADSQLPLRPIMGSSRKIHNIRVLSSSDRTFCHAFTRYERQTGTTSGTITSSALLRRIDRARGRTRTPLYVIAKKFSRRIDCKNIS